MRNTDSPTILAPALAVALAFAVAGPGCKDDKKAAAEDPFPDAGDTDTGTGDEDEDPGRGDPADFPEDCIESCTEACEAIDECGAADNEHFPLGAEECLDRCLLGLPGYMWDDVTGHFRCCASQEECADIEVCGGWLAHPATVDPCAKLCGCMFGGSAAASLWPGVAPPPGYRFAPGTLVAEALDATVDWAARYGAGVVSQGRFGILRFDPGVLPLAAAALAARERLLPTFVDGAGRVAAATGGVFVGAADADGLDAARAALTGRGLPPPAPVRWAAGLHYSAGDDGWLALEALADLSAIPGVTVELDMLRYYEPRHLPNDPLFDQQWHLLNVGQGGTAISGIDSRVSEAWDLVMGSAEVVIAILDDGVDVHHPDLSSKSLDPYNYPDDWESLIGSMMFASHGTSCAGVALAEADNGEGGAGVCPGCTLLPALLAGASGPTPGPGFQLTDQEIAAIFVDLVDLGAWIISNSWGPAGEDPSVESSGFPAPSLPATVAAAFAYAETTGRNGLGTVILYAAGNSNQNADSDTYVAHGDVVAVGALDDQGLKSYYSNWGQVLDVVAPSNGGLNRITTTAAGTDSASDPQYTSGFGGTSSACPFAAGVVGLILSAAPNLTAAEARQILFDSADPVDPVWGQWSAGFSRFYGHGLVNAYTAVSRALDICADPDDCPAPSDVCVGPCDGADCAPCRSDRDCADGYACQALPALGATLCVQSGAASCAAGFDLENGHCLPSRAACGLCDQPESCNGRDDDCNGLVDDGIECEGSPRCLQQGWGCPEGMNCAATSCRTACDGDWDCEGQGQCRMAKNRYGQIQVTETVCSSGIMGCDLGCEVLASSLIDEELFAFVECVEAAACATIFPCAMMLPISF